MENTVARRGPTVLALIANLSLVGRMDLSRIDDGFGASADSTSSITVIWLHTARRFAELFDIHKKAMLRWLSGGLGADRGERPYLMRGDEMIRLLNQRQNRKRRQHPRRNFDCFKCRAPREVYFGIAGEATVGHLSITHRVRFTAEPRFDRGEYRPLEHWPDDAAMTPGADSCSGKAR